jgi:hypothetical protein
VATAAEYERGKCERERERERESEQRERTEEAKTLQQQRGLEREREIVCTISSFVVGSVGGTSDGKESNDAESDGEIDRIRKERARADADATKTTIFSGTNNNLLQLLRWQQTSFGWQILQQSNQTMQQSSIHSQQCTAMQCNALKNKISNQFENEKSLKTAVAPAAAAAAAATQRLSECKQNGKTFFTTIQNNLLGNAIFKVWMQMGNLISWLPIQNHVELCKSCSKSECK